jgi:hypothetical protein
MAMLLASVVTYYRLSILRRFQRVLRAIKHMGTYIVEFKWNAQVDIEKLVKDEVEKQLKEIINDN